MALRALTVFRAFEKQAPGINCDYIFGVNLRTGCLVEDGVKGKWDGKG